MNLAVRRFLLFFFSIATLASCEDPTDIGIDLQDENQIGTNFTDTISINTGTVLLTDSTLSFKVPPAQAGILADPVLGTLKATTFTEVSLGGMDVKFGENPVADSLVLTLDYSQIFGDKTKPLTLNVYRLTEGFDEKSSYFTNSSLEKQATPLGSATLVPKILEKKKSFADSTTAERLVKIRFNQDFVNELVAQAGTGNLVTQETFESFLKGLAIAPAGDPASVLALNLAADSTKLVLHYKNGAEKKKHIFRFAHSGAISYFTKFEGNRAGTAVAELDQNTEFLPASQTGGESYIQNNTQLLTKLIFPHLEKFKEENKNIVINRAELIVPVKPASTSFLPAPPQLVLYQTNNTNRILKNRSGNPLAVQQNRVGALESTAFPSPLIYDAKRDRYTIDITSYFQAMLLDKKPNDGLLLAPANVAASQSGSFQITPEIRPYRTIISNTPSNKVKLVVYYSKLN
ncbi:DUF4270 family protein [Pontibacter locisalis]|uniref:DUF4270 family protein n=1 Tax=Pontibacter locisalis TaxID=1719035 RepID=A0ABW5ILY2_9BACT